MRSFRAIVLFVSLLAFWQALSARVDPLFIGIGVVAAVTVTAFSLRLLEAVVGPPGTRPPMRLWHLVRFHVWLLLRIPPAGIAVAWVVLNPRRPPRPGVVHFRTGLDSPAARTMLANAITLVPGTMTLNVADDEFIVHAFTPESVADLASARTQALIAKGFGVPPDDPPEMIWEPLHDELPEETATSATLRRAGLSGRRKHSATEERGR